MDKRALARFRANNLRERGDVLDRAGFVVHGNQRDQRAALAAHQLQAEFVRADAANRIDRNFGELPARHGLSERCRRRAHAFVRRRNNEYSRDAVFRFRRASNHAA